jgi:hypothetical protein
MDAIALHLEVRNALSLADELGRHEHALGNDTLAGLLAATRTALSELERELGRSHEDRISPNPMLIERLERELRTLRERSEEIPAIQRPRFGQLLFSLERIVFAELRPSSPVPAKPLFGNLPLKRVIPQNVHSVMDYLAAGAYLLSAKLARTPSGRAVGLALGSSVAGASLITDYRLSIAKVIPIEVHELLDHASGAGAVTAPFLLGYMRKDPVASAIQIATGLGAIVASLFTDYRAVKGLARALRSKGGPPPKKRKPILSFGRRPRVPEVQRPLEGFANPSVLPRLHV